MRFGKIAKTIPVCRCAFALVSKISQYYFFYSPAICNFALINWFKLLAKYFFFNCTIAASSDKP